MDGNAPSQSQARKQVSWQLLILFPMLYPFHDEYELLSSLAQVEQTHTCRVYGVLGALIKDCVVWCLPHLQLDEKSYEGKPCDLCGPIIEGYHF